MTKEANDPVDIYQSPDLATQRRAQLAALIPEAFSEGQLWAGKANAYKALQTPSSNGCPLFSAKDQGRPREKKFRKDMQSEFISFTCL